jgi:hypothetical protein
MFTPTLLHNVRNGRRAEVATTEMVIDALAAYRLTRLVSVDTFPLAVTVRDRITRWSKASDHPAIDELVHCPWCIGFWIAAGVVAIRRSGVRGWDPVARTLALSAAAGVLAHYLSDEVIEVKPAPSDSSATVETLRSAR